MQGYTNKIKKQINVEYKIQKKKISAEQTIFKRRNDFFS